MILKENATLYQIHNILEIIYADILFGETSEELEGSTEQFFLLALESISMARRYMKLAAIARKEHSNIDTKCLTGETK